MDLNQMDTEIIQNNEYLATKGTTQVIIETSPVLENIFTVRTVTTDKTHEMPSIDKLIISDKPEEDSTMPSHPALPAGPPTMPSHLALPPGPSILPSHHQNMLKY